MSEPTDGEARALAALEASGLRFRITRHAAVRSLAEAAAARHLRPEQVVKTIVVRRGADDYLFVLVPGGRTISWPRLRALLGVSRLSMPDAVVAREDSLRNLAARARQAECPVKSRVPAKCR